MYSLIRFAQILIYVFGIIACSSIAIPPTATPTQASSPIATLTSTPILFVNHPKPELSITFDVFKDVGCPLEQYGEGLCNRDSPLFAFECAKIREPSNLLGGLEPAYPIATCIVISHLLNPDEPGKVESKMMAEGEYFYRGGGIVPEYIRYVIVRNNQFQLIKTEDEFRKIYAPIETPEEALSYVLAVKDLSAYYGLKQNPDYEYRAEVIEDTYVKPIANGYHLHLYHYELYTCGPHWKSVVEMQITFEGIIQEISREQVFYDRTFTDCID